MGRQGRQRDHKDVSQEEFEAKTKFFVETQIVPSMDELNAVRARRTELQAIAALGRDDKEAQRLERSLIDFVEAAWPPPRPSS